PSPAPRAVPRGPSCPASAFDEGGEFSSDLLRDFCHAEGILLSFMLPASPHKNGVAEHRIGLVMEVARTSMIHAVAPHFQWHFAVRYAAHQLNLWPHVSLPETSPTLRWTGKVGDASVFRVWGSRAFVRNSSADKLSSRALPCVFLGLPPYLAPCPPLLRHHGPAPSGVSQVDPLLGSVRDEVAVDSGAARGAASGDATSGGAASGGAASGGAASRGAEPASAEHGGAEPEGAKSGGVEPGGAEHGGTELEGAEPGGAESGGAEPWGTASIGGPAGALQRLSPRREPLSPQQPREWSSQRTCLRSGAPGAGGSPAGGTGDGGAGDVGACDVGDSRAGDPEAGGAGVGGIGAGGAGASGPGGVGITTGARGTGGAGAAGPGGARTSCTGAAGYARAGGVGGTGARGARAGGAGAGDTGAGGARAGGSGAGDPGAGGAGARGTGAGGNGVGGARTGGAGAGDSGAGGAGAGGAGAGGTGARGTVQRLLSPLPHQSQPQLQPDSPLPALSPYAEKTDSFTERRKPESHPASPVCAVCTGRRVPRPHPPLVPSAHILELRPSSVPLRVPLPPPPASSLPAVLDPESDLARAASPTIPHLLGSVVTNPSFESTVASALVAELVEFSAACRLDYATSLVVESESHCLLSVGGECVLGTNTREDRGNYRFLLLLVEDSHGRKEGIMEVHRHLLPLVFKAHYIARGFSQRQGVDFFQTFSPTVKMTTLRVLHVAAQHDYELHSLGFSIAFLQGSLHEEIWLRRPPGFTGSFPAWRHLRLFGLLLRLLTHRCLYASTPEAQTLVNLGLQKRHTCTDLGELHNYHGLQITRDRAPRTVTLTQSHMVRQVLQRFGFRYSSPQSTPPPTGHSLSAPPSDESVEQSGPYPELVGCLITSEMGLVLGGRGPVVLTGHADASWVDDLATQWSSQGYTFNLGSGSVSWRSTRSSSVLSSGCEAEIYAGAMAAQDLRWLTYLLTDLGERPRVSQVDPLPGTVPAEIVVDSRAAKGAASGGAEPMRAELGSAQLACAEPGGAESEGAGSRGAEPWGVEPRGIEPAGVEPRGAESAGAEPGGAELEHTEPGGTLSTGGPPNALSPPQLHEWFAPRTRLRSTRAGAAGGTGAAGPGGTSTGGFGAAGAGGAAGFGARGTGAGSPGGTGAAGAGGAVGVGAGGIGGGVARGFGAAGSGGARTGATGATGAGGAAGVGAADPGAGDPGAGGATGVGAGDLGAGDPRAGGAGPGGACAVGACSGDTGWPQPYFVPLLQQVLGLPSSTGLTPSLLCPPPDQSQPPLQPDSPLHAPSPYTEQTGGLTKRREPFSRPASPVRAVRIGRRVPRPRPPPIPGTHHMALRPSSVPLRVPLPSPPASSPADGPDPESDLVRAASPTVPHLLATVVTDPSFESVAASALVAELVDIAVECLLDYAATLIAKSESDCPPSVGGERAICTDVLEDTQEDFECFSAAVPHLVSMLIASEGDPDAPDIPTPRSYTEAITGPYSSQWQTAMDAEMASWKSTSTYVDAVPPHGDNIVDGMWIFRVKRPPGSPPTFKACYVARGFSQRQGVDFFQTFSLTPKMTALRVSLHVATHHDYELHSLDFSTAFLQGSLHEEVWLCRPPSFTGSFLASTQWSLRWPVYGLHQAPREWHDTLRTTLAALGFAPSTADMSLFLRTNTSLPPFCILVYVDDLVFATADTKALALVKSELQKRHTCTDLGELRSYLGLQITRDRARCTLTLTQSHMVQQSVEPSGPYPELVGCLMYLMTCTRPDLAYPLSILARYVAPGRHRPEQWEVAKRVLRYLCSTSGMGLVLGGRGPVVLAGVEDASWLTYLLTNLGERPRSSPVLYVYNKAMIALCQEHRTKHIALRYFLARGLQQCGHLRLAYVATRANTADIFTKALQPGDQPGAVLGLVPSLPHLLTA
ncbi:unnamed protein product, partial [Closterium sp. NIES-53]